MNLNKRIISAMIAVLSLFVVMVIYLTYFTLSEGPEQLRRTDANSKRLTAKENKVLRGTIYDANGEVLAETDNSSGVPVRVYPYDELYAHVVGYNSSVYGKTKLEYTYDNYLMKSRNAYDLIATNADDDAFDRGANLHLTIDHELTKRVKKIFDENDEGIRGSVIVMNPKTGEIYCLFSNPSFDPNAEVLDEDRKEYEVYCRYERLQDLRRWKKEGTLKEDSKEELNQLEKDETLQKLEKDPEKIEKMRMRYSMSEDDIFTARATGKVYPPGSTFKIVTAAAAVRCGEEDYVLDDKTGKINVGGRTFQNYIPSGNDITNMRTAFEVSSNVYFAGISERIGKKTFAATVEDFYVHNNIPFDIETANYGLDYSDKKVDTSLLASIAQGEGDGYLKVTPLHMALIACAVANDGVIMQPYMVKEVSYDDGEILYENGGGTVLTEAMDSRAVDIITDGMYQAIYGMHATGFRAKEKIKGVKIAGKTGTATVDGPKDNHGWFVGFAPVEDPEIVLCVMKENAGSGGIVAAPIAGAVFKELQDLGYL